MRITAVFLLIALAGCTDGANDEAEYNLTGAFTADRSNEDLQTLTDVVHARGGDVAIMESFPEQFHISKVALDDCEALAAMLDAWDVIQSRSDCKAAV